MPQPRNRLQTMLKRFYKNLESTPLVSRIPRLLFSCGALFIGSFFLSNGPLSPDYTFEVMKNVDIFGKVMRELTLRYVDDVDPDKYFKAGIDSMLYSLDPYTNYIPEEQADDYRYLTTGQYGGIGAQIGMRSGRFVVIRLYANRPAMEAGLKVGDELLAIDDKSLDPKTMNNENVRQLLLGTPKTPVRLTIKRYGQDKSTTYTVTRQDIKLENVTCTGFVQPGIAYIRLDRFTQDAGLDVRNAYEQLKSQDPNLKGVILDLRSNPGGLLNEAVNVSNLFVPRGETIVETKGRMEGTYKRYEASQNPIDLKTPLVVLVNGTSASASEIVAGVVQDLDRGVIVGQKSWGKGLVQTSRPLSYKSQIKMTTAKYYTPSGRCIQSINYGERKNGKVRKTPDSLKHVFHTRSNRKVVDGDGITPDIITDEPEYHKLTRDLLDQHLVFDFATQFYYQNPTIAPARQFKIDDNIYNQFMAFVKAKNFSSESKLAKDLEALKASLKEEAYYSQVEGQFEGFRNRLNQLSQNDIIALRKEVETWLEFEITSRYYQLSGAYEASFDTEGDINEGVKILNNPTLYRSILNGTYVQPKK